jgi:uroporphyrinogen-III decarboxylase
MKESVFEDKMPWIEKHLSKEEIRNLEFPGDVKKCGLVPRAVEYIKYFKEKLDGKVNIYLPDTQGPFDIAHLIRGEDIFTDVYDDPKFAYHLMELSTKAYIEVTKVLKEAIGEELNSGYHNNMYMGAGGVRICEDSTTILSPPLAKEFAIPYTKRALEAFGGGYIHYCGNGNHILDFFLDIKELKGINFGNSEMHDYTQVMGKLREKGKFYYGSWYKRADENMQDYFKRVLKPLGGVKKSLIFVPSGGSEKDWQEPAKAVSLWHSLQT